MRLFEFVPGTIPLLWSAPHPGTHIPLQLEARMTPAALQRADTDWNMPRLYDFVRDLGAHVLHATHSRYVIDLNRDPSGVPLYPGADNTELCPTSTAQWEPLYREGQAPGPDEIAERTARYWQPYHDQLRHTLDAIRARHGYALLFDAHSIRSELPRFFEGRLPDINLGTADQASAAPAIGPQLLEAAQRFPDYASVLNGRFKGGYITRAYGHPARGIHAVQLELTWRCYMDEAGSFAFDEARAARIRPTLRALVERLIHAGTALA